MRRFTWNAMIKWNFLLKDEEMWVFSLIIYSSFSLRDHRYLSTLEALAQKFKICILRENGAPNTNTGPLRGAGAMQADLSFIHWIHCFWTSVFMDISRVLLTKTGWFWINTVTLEHSHRSSSLAGVIYTQAPHTSISTSFLRSLRDDKLYDYMSCLNRMRDNLHDKVTESILRCIIFITCNVVRLAAAALPSLLPHFYPILCLLEAVITNI